ncbi:HEXOSYLTRANSFERASE [Salix viminalis]|uniref:HEXOSYLTRANSFERASE n=1 Tax=Salix viminalis TaxID=40686 RepID=A0A9Q0UTI9_SALVM|nr:HEXOSYLTRANSFERASE [Salix viminalis]
MSRGGRVTNKVSVKWILFVCGFCFATGILFSNRLWDSSAEPRSQQNLSHNDDAMDESLKAHESIQSLDKSVAMLQMQSAAPMSSQEMSLDSSAAVSTLSREGSARKKVFMVIGINTDLVVERDVIQLERLGCLKMDSQENWSMLESLVLAKEVAMWDAEFYVKVDDDVHVNLGMLASTLDRHRSKPRVTLDV